jgi:DNA-binding IclR family transcriptional regulator
LVESGYVMQHVPSGRYGLTLKLTMLGLRHYVRTGLDDLAQPVLDRLAADTGELARLAVVEGERLVWVAKAQGARSGLRYDPDLDHDTGHDVVLHATATGKAWLATMPQAQAMRIVEATELHTPRGYGPNIATSLHAFGQMLKTTRQAGFGVALDEGEPGTAAVAVAVVDASASGAAVGTLSLAGPLSRFGPERRSFFAARLGAGASRSPCPSRSTSTEQSTCPKPHTRPMKGRWNCPALVRNTGCLPFARPISPARVRAPMRNTVTSASIRPRAGVSVPNISGPSSLSRKKPDGTGTT